MVMRRSNRGGGGGGWVDFRQNNNTFSSESDKSTSRTQSRKGGNWMQEPIRTEEAWVPMEPMSSPVIVNPRPVGVPGGNHPASPSGRGQQPTKLRPPSRQSQQDAGSINSRGRRSDSQGARSSSLGPAGRPTHIRVGGGTNDSVASKRSRASSLPRTPSQQQQQDHSFRGGGEGGIRPPSSTRGRSNSRNRSAPQEKRERSISQSRSVGGNSQTSHRSSRSNRNKNGGSNSQQQPRARGRSRPPVTARNGRDGGGGGGGGGGSNQSTGGRSRSFDGRSRPARSRSASLTRVTNTPHPPPSPAGVRSVTSNSGTTPRPPPHNVQRQPTRNGSTHSRNPPDETNDHDANIGRDISFSNTNGGRVKSNASQCSADSRRMKTTGPVGDVFGEQQGGKKLENGMGDQIRPRVLLAATVYHNTATGLWITTINTNQKGVARDPKLANKFLKAFSFPSEQEARESAIANAPPKMVPFGECQSCFLCKSSFSVFKRACHCRNCGVCVCKDCSVQWPAKSLPETYNLKNEAVVKVCRSCNTLARAFRRALQQGDYDGARALYGTGNVNLRSPFPPSTKKDEMIWPVHSAVEGGNLHLLRWLVDEQFCPITTIPSSGTKNKPRRGSPESLIITSMGRHVLSIAIERLKVDIMHYLVVERGVSIYESRELEPSLRALEATLLALPRAGNGNWEPSTSGEHHATAPVTAGGVEPRWDSGSYDDMSIPSTIGFGTTASKPSEMDDAGTVGTKQTNNSDYCIICFERKIDCVATPCGHQICCLECSSNLQSCPVCNHKGDFIKIFRP